jgi:hypothetical protein
MSAGPTVPWKRATLALILFGVSFGYLEAAVVVYLRQLYDPLRAEFHPNRDPGELFPLLRADQLLHKRPEYLRLVVIEIAREAATLLMLSAVALAVTRTAGQWLAAFGVAFGIWDILFYVSLKILIDWPASLFTWDILFLIPVPWVGPVIAPVLVSLTMIACGMVYLVRQWQGLAVHARTPDWIGVLLGALLLILAFTWDFRNTSNGGMPNPFNWPLFAAGQIAGLAAFVRAIKRKPSPGVK